MSDYKLFDSLNTLQLDDYEPDLLSAMIYLSYLSFDESIRQKLRNKFPIFFTNYFIWH